MPHLSEDPTRLAGAAGSARQHPGMRLLPPLALACALAASLGLSGCGEDDEIFRANPAPYEDKVGQEITAEIAGLGNGGKTDVANASVAYDNAIQSLIMRGVKAETRVIDALRSDPDPHVRIGCIEVLVAWNAEITLRVMGRTRMIPEAGQPPKDGLPPVPLRKPDDLALEADERIWNTWYDSHKAELKAAWERWWADSKATFKVE